MLLAGVWIEAAITQYRNRPDNAFLRTKQYHVPFHSFRLEKIPISGPFVSFANTESTSTRKHIHEFHFQWIEYSWMKRYIYVRRYGQRGSRYTEPTTLDLVYFDPNDLFGDSIGWACRINRLLYSQIIYIFLFRLFFLLLFSFLFSLVVMQMFCKW